MKHKSNKIQPLLSGFYNEVFLLPSQFNYIIPVFALSLQESSYLIFPDNYWRYLSYVA